MAKGNVFALVLQLPPSFRAKSFWRRPFFLPLMYRSFPKTAPPPRKHRDIWRLWKILLLCCQFRRSNAPPVRASKRVKSFIQMYIFCDKELATVWINNRPEQKRRGCFNANIYLWKKTLIQRILYVNQTRSPKEREALNIWILIREITRGMQHSVKPCTPEINEYKQNRFNTCKIFSHYEFLVQLAFAPHFKQRHIPKTHVEWPVNAAHVLNQRNAKSFGFQPLTDVLTRKSNAPPGG